MPKPGYSEKELASFFVEPGLTEPHFGSMELRHPSNNPLD